MLKAPVGNTFEQWFQGFSLRSQLIGFSSLVDGGGKGRDEIVLSQESQAIAQNICRDVFRGF